ncbi:YheC/YheD family protein [Paenibacillus sp. FJAT-27812]|uniref:YheC/YheD family protein n=1 Tax=Paenibacillus sp. FJAT-27812 TaxID=1684143 RepID=UPI0006A77C1B|nr:YheC/YheD family protein [Paenibacillus sp. FJAT-27812]
MGSVASKWKKTESLLQDKKLRGNVPMTKRYSNLTLKAMLDSYSMVYVKPNTGTGGSGVMRVEKLTEGYKYQLLTTTRKFTSFRSLAKSISRRTKDRSYLIQRGIHLLKYKGRSIDLRVMVQKNVKGKWEPTGEIGRIGHHAKIVTNVCKGGTSKPVEMLLESRVDDMKAFKQKLRRLGLQTAYQLNRTFKSLNEIGMDVGVDRKLKLWIIEVNTRPAIYGFKSLRDKSVYKKICRYQKRYAKR